MLKRLPSSKTTRHFSNGSKESSYRKLSQNQRTTAYREVNQERRECPSRRFFVYPSVSCGLRHATPCGRCLCFVTVPIGVRKGPFWRARFGAKLSESRVGPCRRVNRPFPFGVLVFDGVKSAAAPETWVFRIHRSQTRPPRLASPAAVNPLAVRSTSTSAGRFAAARLSCVMYD